MHQVNVRLNDELYGRLGKLANKTGKTVSFYVKEAIIEHLEDLEDMYLAKKVLRENQGQSTYSLAEMRKRLDLED